MTATIIDGKAIAQSIRNQVKEHLTSIKEKHPHFNPQLAIIQVGEREDSSIYVRMKDKAAKEIGVSTSMQKLPKEISQSELLKKVQELNKDHKIHGILVQMPLPSHISESAVIEAIDYKKDVDGFHPFNIGNMAKKNSQPLFLPCTPKGIIQLIESTGVEIAGKHAVVIGRSDIVGSPVATLLTAKHATVTLCHSKTVNIESFVKLADIVVAAAGKAELVKGDWIKPGAVVIDVGTNAVEDSTKKSGFRYIGDVEYSKAKEIASFITPVPGGVGPMTVAMLMQNTAISAERFMKERVGSF